MKFKNIVFIVLISCCFIGCRSISVNKSEMHTATTTPVALGVIGIHENQLLHTDFQVTSIPEFKKGIRVGITPVDFNKAAFKTYISASTDNKQQMTYIDSLESKPQFLKLELIDWVSTISELTQSYNQQTLTYIKRQSDAEIVSSISMAVKKEILDEINKAEAVFLINNQYKQYKLSLLKNDQTYKTIDFGDCTIFGYQLSHFCWGENTKKRVELFDIVDEKESCPKNTYKKAEKAKNNINYLKL